MASVETNPELMTVIINIQTMKRHIYPIYNAKKDFRKLKTLDSDKLYEIQSRILEEYNQTFKTE